VTLAAVTEVVILPKERLVVTAEGLIEATDLLVAARMSLPERLDLCFVHGALLPRLILKFAAVKGTTGSAHQLLSQALHLPDGPLS
jgi:hypothetical protein